MLEALEATPSVTIPLPSVRLAATLDRPPSPRGSVIFAHGSGSSRFSPRNRFVAAVLHEAGFATLLADLLTPREEALDVRTGQFRFDIALLGQRVAELVDWVATQPGLADLPIGLFGASTGAAAALRAAAERPPVRAVVSRGGRPDLAAEVLPRVRVPVLLIVGGSDLPVLTLHQQVLHRFGGPHQLVVIPGASHLFEEPGALEQVATLARDWFLRYLTAPAGGQPPA
ncbi:MAG: hypothetical protein KatS3mg061_0905 [Dehalococcoidia bacterium]|nr:MAG: hypothetical protein KatS3mg061_0905 [Dehalococcoidia bacterium]